MTPRPFEHTTRPAMGSDITALCRFTDFWIAGRGKRIGAPGAVNDCFLSPTQHRKYIRKYTVLILLEGDDIIGWAVKQHDGSLIHLLVAGTHRHRCYGSQLLKAIAPTQIHSKSDQSSGNPAPFYTQNGFTYSHSQQSKPTLSKTVKRPNKSKNIDIFKRCNSARLTS